MLAGDFFHSDCIYFLKKTFCDFAHLECRKWASSCSLVVKWNHLLTYYQHTPTVYFVAIYLMSIQRRISDLSRHTLKKLSFVLIKYCIIASHTIVKPAWDRGYCNSTLKHTTSTAKNHRSYITSVWLKRHIYTQFKMNSINIMYFVLLMGKILN